MLGGRAILPAATVVAYAVLWFLLSAVSAEKAVSLRAYICADGLRRCTHHQRVGFPPADIVIEVLVPQHPENRRLRASVFCPALGDLNPAPSERQLEGARARTFHRFEYRGMGACEYLAAALVDSQTRTRGTATQPVIVVAP